MQSPPPIGAAAVATDTAAASARETASALEALLEIKHSPPSILGTANRLLVPTPTTALQQQEQEQQLGANLQIPTTIPTAGIAAPAPGAVVGATMHQSNSRSIVSALLPPHMYFHNKSFLPTAVVAHNPHNNSSGVMDPGVNVVHPTMDSPAHPIPPVVGMAAESPPATRVPTTASSSSVRDEEIKAALASKPQRGKKRNNLTAEERKELTKTRNREHARTTRIRKKAKNDELLAIETKYHELMQREELNQARQTCVRGFFSIRTEMLSRALSPASTDGKETNSCEFVASISSLLDTVIENQWLFEVSTGTLKGATVNGIATLCKFDESMANSIKSNYPAHKVLYKLGTDSIAIVNDTAIAIVDIIDQLTQEIIVTLTVQFKFGSGLSKIRSLSWSASSSFGTADLVAGTHHPQSKQQEKNPATFPSIVSMHSVSSLDRTSPSRTGVTKEQETTISRKLTE